MASNEFHFPHRRYFACDLPERRAKKENMLTAAKAQIAALILHERLAGSQRTSVRSMPTTKAVRITSAKTRARGRYFQSLWV
jgi:hypothetical protein